MQKALRIKTIPPWVVRGALCVGSVVVAGLLSFSGMFAIWPIIPVAVLSLFFAVIYEGQVYSNNISEAWDKIFKPNALKHIHAKQLLKSLIEENYLANNMPEFLQDYVQQLALLKPLDDKKYLTAESKAIKKKIEDRLTTMEEWFAMQLFKENDDNDESDYAKELQSWLRGDEYINLDHCVVSFEEISSRNNVKKQSFCSFVNDKDLKKINKTHKHIHAKQLLKSLIAENYHANNMPKFLQDYVQQLALLEPLDDKKYLTAESKAIKKKIEDRLTTMEEWFALFKENDDNDESDYAKELQSWLRGDEYINLDHCVVSFEEISSRNNVKKQSFRSLVNDKGLKKINKTHKTASETICFHKSVIPADVQSTANESSSRDEGFYCCELETKKLHYINNGNSVDFVLLSEEVFRRISCDSMRILLTPEQQNVFNIPNININIKSESIELFRSRERFVRPLQVVSILGGLCMGFGTTYLLMEAFTVITIFAAIPVAIWPALIVPLAIVACISYGMLTYNACIDMTMDNTFLSWLADVKQAYKDGFPNYTIYRTLGIAFLMALSLILTICTAGTWWTVVKNSKPLFQWITKIPILLFEILIPMVIGVTTLVFNVSNVFDTIAFLDENLLRLWRGLGLVPSYVYKSLSKTWQEENLLQIINPFRLITNVIEKPLRVIFFLLHLVGIAVSSDRFPGIPEILSALIGIICEGAEDLHYFVQDVHESCEDAICLERLSPAGHDHADDLPTLFLKAAFLWAHYAAAFWDFYTSKFNAQDALTWDKALQRCGVEVAEEVGVNDTTPSVSWLSEERTYRINEEIIRLENTTFAAGNRDAKIAALNELKQDDTIDINKHIEQYKETYDTHRIWSPLFVYSSPTSTREFVTSLVPSA